MVTYDTGRITLLCWMLVIGNSDTAGVGPAKPHVSENATWNVNATIIVQKTGLQPFGLFINNLTNSVYVVGQSPSEVLKIDPQTLSISVVAGGVGTGPGNASLNQPTSVFLDSNGSLFVLDNAPYRALRFPPNSTNGTQGTIIIGNGTAGPDLNLFKFSYYIYVDIHNQIYISDRANNRVLKYNSGSKFGVYAAGTTAAGNNSNQLKSPYGIYVDDEGTLFIADGDNGRIQKWLQNASNGSTLLSNLKKPSSVTMDSDGRLYVAEADRNRIIRFDPNVSGSYTCIAACFSTNESALNQLNAPFDVKLDIHGNLIVSDSNNGRVLNFTLSNIELKYTTMVTTSSRVTTSKYATSKQSDSLSSLSHTTMGKTSSQSSSKLFDTSTQSYLLSSLAHITTDKTLSQSSSKLSDTSTQSHLLSSSSSTTMEKTSTQLSSKLYDTSTQSHLLSSLSRTTMDETSSETSSKPSDATTQSHLLSSLSHITTDQTSSQSFSKLYDSSTQSHLLSSLSHTTTDKTSSQPSSELSDTTTQIGDSLSSLSHTTTDKTSSQSSSKLYDTSTQSHLLSSLSHTTTDKTSSQSSSKLSDTSTQSLVSSVATPTTAINSFIQSTPNTNFTHTSIQIWNNTSTCDFIEYPPYKISNNKADFDNAQACCQSMNMTLVEIDSATEQNRLMSISTFVQDSFYIGLDGQCDISNYTQWLSGKMVTYSNWKTGQPLTCLSSRQCVVAAGNASSVPWIVVNCSISFRFICEPYTMLSLKWMQSPFSGNTNMRFAHATNTPQQVTFFEQINLGRSSLLNCAKQCLMNADCVSISFNNNICQLILN